MVYSRRILLVALGTTPHLLTTTLAALYKKNPGAMPTEIHVLSTQAGADCVKREFVNKKENFLSRFCSDYEITPLVVETENLHVICSEDGSPLSDIRTPGDSEGAADYIVRLVRNLCSDPNSSLTVSIVGGRKSMSLLLGSAMTFYGRDQDSVSHILSLEEAPPGSMAYPLPEDLVKNPECVSLGEIPFLRLRPILPPALVNGQFTFSEIVRASQAQLTRGPSITVSLKKDHWHLRIDSVEVRPEKRSLGLYIWLALRTKLQRKTITSCAGLPLEEFFFLRLQLVKVLELVLTEKSWQSACIQYLGLSSARLSEMLKKSMTEVSVDAKALYRWLLGQMSEEEQKNVNEAAFAFSKKISICRTRFNDAVTEELSEVIPDVTHRRLAGCLIESDADKGGAEYSLSTAPDAIALPKELTVLLSGVTTHASQYWKLI